MSVVDLHSYAERRVARITPLVAAVRQVLADARGIFREDGVVTSFIVVQIRTRFPQQGVTVDARNVLYALNDLERRGEVERVPSVKRHPNGKLVPVNRWRKVKR